MNAVAPTSESDPVVVAAADDQFALPLAVTIRSLLQNTTSRRHIRIFVIDAGLSDHNRSKLLKSWDLTQATVHWITPDPAVLGSLTASGHVTRTAFYRVLMPELLPDNVHKAIYLDSDTVVLADIEQLWNLSVTGWHLLAAQDMTAPYMCSPTALTNYAEAAPYLSVDEPLPTWEKLRIPPDARYFNSGVLVFNLDKWRRDAISRKIYDYLHEHEASIRWWDQDGLNAVLYDKWKPLDLRWNQIPHIYRYPSWRESPFDEATYNEIISSPYIIHYATASKPWHSDCTHPAKDIFFEYLRGTQWSTTRLKASWMVQRASRFLRIRK